MLRTRTALRGRGSTRRSPRTCDRLREAAAPASSTAARRCWRGRAGRVAPGVAVHLFSKHTHDKLIDAHQAPEVQRVPLEQLVLRIRAMNLPGTAASVCQRLLEPPSTDAVNKAVMELVSLDALKIDTEAKTEELTDLGKHLANLPVDARLGKLILLGSAFGPEATDMALTAAAALACRSPFLSPPDAREEAEKCKAAFAEGGAGLESKAPARGVGNVVW